MGVILDGVPVLIGRQRQQATAVQTLSVEIMLNLQAIRTGRFGAGEHLRQLNPERFANVLAVDGSYELWQAASLAQASVSDLEKRLSAGKGNEVVRGDLAVRRIATAARVLHSYLQRRAGWFRGSQITLAALVGLLVIVASLYLLTSPHWPDRLQIALPAYFVGTAVLILVIDIVTWIWLRWEMHVISKEYMVFDPYPSIAEAILA